MIFRLRLPTCLGVMWLVLAGSAPAFGAPAAPGPDATTPDPVGEIDDLFACRAGGDAPSIAWSMPPVAVAEPDPIGDVGVPAGASAAPPSVDLTGWFSATTGPLDDTTFDRLFGERGLLAPGSDGIMTPSYDIDLESFRAGVSVTGIRRAADPEAYTAPADNGGVAVLAFDPRYPAPATGNFAGINKGWRLDSSAAGDAVNYVQFTGTAFQAFRANLLFVDGCEPDTPPAGGLRAPAPGSGGNYIFVFTNVENEAAGITTERVELFERRGGSLFVDTSRPWDTASISDGAWAVKAPPPPVVPVTTPPPTGSTTVTTVTVGAPPAKPAEDPRDEKPAVVAAPDSNSGIGLLPKVLIPAGLAMTFGGVYVLRRKKPERPTSALGYATTGTSDGPRTALATDTDIAWSHLLERNSEAEHRVTEASLAAARLTVGAITDYAGVVGEFTHPYRRAVSGLALILAHDDEREQKVEQAKIADIAAGVLNLAMLVKMAGKMGLKGFVWVLSKSREAWRARAAVEAAKDVVLSAERTKAVGEFVSVQMPEQLAAAPSWFHGDDAFFRVWTNQVSGLDGKDVLFWQMSRMADEVGVSLEHLMLTGSIDQVLETLRIAVANRRGALLYQAPELLRLERLLIQARNAERHQPHVFQIDDLQWLFSKNSAEGRAELARAVSELEVASSATGADIAHILSPDDVRLINGILDRPGLGEALAEVPGNIRIELPPRADISEVFDVGHVGQVDPTATGAFGQIIDLPAPDVVRVGADGWGTAYIPPTVGPGRLLDDVLDGFPVLDKGIPDTIQPGQLFPWMHDAERTAKFGDVLTDAGKTGTFDQVLSDAGRTGTFDQVLDITDTVAPGSMSAIDAGRFADAVIGSGRSGVVSGPGTAEVLGSLPSTTPVTLTLPSGERLTGTIAEISPTLHNPSLFQTGLTTFGVFGQAYQTLSNDALGATVRGAAGLQLTADGRTVWIGELRPPEVAVLPTGDLPAGSNAVFTEAGVIFTDPSQPAFGAPDAPVVRGLRTGAAAAHERPPIQIPLTTFAPQANWLDPAWIASQQQAIGEMGAGLAGVKDVKTLLENLMDPSFGKDFCFFGADLDGDSHAAKLAWLTMNLAMSPFESMTRITYFFTGAPMIGNYVENYASDYHLMRDLVGSGVQLLESLTRDLPAAIGVLRDERSALAAVADDVARFGRDNPDWVRDHPAVFDAKVARDAMTLGHLDSTLASLDHLRDLLGNVLPWVRAVAFAPDGSALPPYMLVQPTTLMRLSSALLMLGDALGRVTLVASPPTSAPQPDTVRRGPERLDKTVPGSYLERDADDPQVDEDTDLDDFNRRVNSADPVGDDDH